jgi:hypothetical protein
MLPRSREAGDAALGEAHKRQNGINARRFIRHSKNSISYEAA